MDLYIKQKDYDNIVEHCIRKLNGDFFDDETKEKQAFGIILGKKEDSVLKITKVINLKKNYRFETNISNKMNQYIEKYAIPGGMEISERAWAVDPLELNTILINMKSDEIFLGTYHMHSNFSWIGDFPKNLPTKLDRELNNGSGLINLIVYIGNIEREIRAFFESNVDDEYKLIINEEE